MTQDSPLDDYSVGDDGSLFEHHTLNEIKTPLYPPVPIHTYTVGLYKSHPDAEPQLSVEFHTSHPTIGELPPLLLSFHQKLASALGLDLLAAEAMLTSEEEE